MKFLAKKQYSEVLAQNLTYTSNHKNNKLLLETLLAEQRNFCAYSECYVTSLDSPELEHFDSSLKYSDDYYNYYVVLRKMNLVKRDQQYAGASFFTTRFYQNSEELNKRIQYVKGDFVFEERNTGDTEAAGFIHFLGLSDFEIADYRKRHVTMLKDTFSDAGYDMAEIQVWFSRHLHMLKFVTAIEIELGVDLSPLYT